MNFFDRGKALSFESDSPSRPCVTSLADVPSKQRRGSFTISCVHTKNAAMTQIFKKKIIIQRWLTFGLFHWIFLGRLLSLEIPMEASEVGNDGSRQGTPRSVWCLFNLSYFWSLNTSIMMGQTEQTHREVEMLFFMSCSHTTSVSVTSMTKACLMPTTTA